MNQMTWIAGVLLAVLAVIVGGAWIAGGSDETSGGAGGGGANVKFDEALAGQGEGVASAQGCTACHSVDGSTSAGPTWAGLYGSEVELESGTTKANDAYIEESIVDPGAEIRAGFSASMPAFADLSDQDMAALIEYIKSVSG